MVRHHIGADKETMKKNNIICSICFHAAHFPLCYSYHLPPTRDNIVLFEIEF